MSKNVHGFMEKQRFDMGGLGWMIYATGSSYVKCIATKSIGKMAFDEEGKNNFAAASLREHLNGPFLEGLIRDGAPKDIFSQYEMDLMTDDGLDDYGSIIVKIGLVTCDEYRVWRKNIPVLPGEFWWTATADSPGNHLVRIVYTDGSLYYHHAFNGYFGVRPVCILKSDILKEYLRSREEPNG